MKRFLYSIGIILFLTLGVFGDSTVLDYKSKSKTNEKERTYLLDLLRANLSNEFKQEFVFVVEHFKISGDYAWFRGTAKRKDGKEITFSEEIPYDCCHVEALFKKQWEVANF